MTEDIDIEEWARSSADDPLPAANGFRIRLWDGDGFDEKRRLADATPTGAQVLDAFGRHPVNEYVLLLLDRDGLNEVAPDEIIQIGDRRAERFFAFRTDRLWFGAMNDKRFPWGKPTISETILRLVFRVPLDDAGLERLFTRKSVWKLLVQGVTLTFDTPKILVKDALVKAGLDPDRGWTAILKFVGLPKEPVALTDTIDLSRKGIEKLWLRPNHVNNGEAPSGLHRAFSLRDEDILYLSQRSLEWDAVVDGGQRWFILRNYPLPPGYRQHEVDIAVLIPPTYPAASLDMFFCAPHLSLVSGRTIPCTQTHQAISGVSFQRWSRHRHADTVWNPAVDSLITHIALIDDAITREVEGGA